MPKKYKGEWILRLEINTHVDCKRPRVDDADLVPVAAPDPVVNDGQAPYRVGRLAEVEQVVVAEVPAPVRRSLEHGQRTVRERDQHSPPYMPARIKNGVID